VTVANVLDSGSSQEAVHAWICATVEEGKHDIESAISRAREHNARGWPGVADATRLDRAEFEWVAEYVRHRYLRVNPDFVANWMIRACILYGYSLSQAAGEALDINRMSWVIACSMFPDESDPRHHKNLSNEEMRAAIAAARRWVEHT